MLGPLISKCRYRTSGGEFRSDECTVIIMEIDPSSDSVILVDENGVLKILDISQVELLPDIKISRLSGVPAGGIIPH